MRSHGQAGAQRTLSQRRLEKTADNPKTVGFCLNKASFIFGYVGNLTDSPREEVRFFWSLGVVR
jgi:hypothetical protein